MRLIFAQNAFSPEDDTLEVTVTAYEWWWAFEYAELGVVTANPRLTALVVMVTEVKRLASSGSFNVA